jgi:hypothetical protein
VCYLVGGGLASGRRTSDHDSKSDVERVVQLQNLVDVQRHSLQTLLSQLVTNRSVKADKQTVNILINQSINQSINPVNRLANQSVN